MTFTLSSNETSVTKMSSDLPPDYEVVIYTASDLRAAPVELGAVVAAINLAFARHETAGFHGPRFAADADLLTMLGTHGICAVLRPSPSSGLGQDVVRATGSAIPWRPQRGGEVEDALKAERPDEFRLVKRNLSYEVKAVVTTASPDTRGKGLAGLCVDALVQHLAAQHPGESELVLWIQLAENQNGPYWRRRGYEQVGGVEVKPKGMWGSERDFEFATLVKKVATPRR